MHDELVARAPSSRCITCRFLGSLSSEDRAEWIAEMRDITVTNNALAQAITKRGSRVAEGAVRGHRVNHS